MALELEPKKVSRSETLRETEMVLELEALMAFQREAVMGRPWESQSAEN
jgi:hypothetical protein